MTIAEIEKAMREKAAKVINQETFIEVLLLLDFPGIKIDACGPSGKTALCFAFEYLVHHLLQADEKVDLTTVRFKLSIIEEILARGADNKHLYDVAKESIHKLQDTEARIKQIMQGKVVQQSGIMTPLTPTDALRISAICYLQNLFSTAKKVNALGNDFINKNQHRLKSGAKLGTNPIVFKANYLDAGTSKFLKAAESRFLAAGYKAICLDYPIESRAIELYGRYKDIANQNVSFKSTPRFRERLRVLQYAVEGQLCHNVYFLDPGTDSTKVSHTDALLISEARGLLNLDMERLRGEGIKYAALNAAFDHDGKVLIVIDGSNEQLDLVKELKKYSKDCIVVSPATDDKELSIQLDRFANQLPKPVAKSRLMITGS